VAVTTGAQPHGQSQETTLSQIVEQVLGLGIDQIKIIHSDTNGPIFGQGSYGSRSYCIEGTAVYKAAHKIKEKACRMAAHILKVPVEDIIYQSGRMYPKDEPNRVQTFQQICLVV
jgi:carbon-monoxide dehydrogenase large subunit